METGIIAGKSVLSVRPPISMKGVLNLSQLGTILRSPQLKAGYNLMYDACTASNAPGFMKGLLGFSERLKSETVAMPLKLGRSVRTMLDIAVEHFYAELLTAEEETFSRTVLEVGRIVVTEKEFNVFALELLEKAFALKDPHVATLLGQFLGRCEELLPAEKQNAVSLYHRIGQEILSDPLIEDPLLQIIVLSDMFYFNLYDMKIAEMIFGAANKLFKQGDKAVAVEHFAQVWRNVRRKNDQAAMDICSEIKSRLLGLFGVADALIADFSTKEACLASGVSADYADIVPLMVKNVLYGADVDQVLSALRIFGRTSKKSTEDLVRELLEIALSGDVVTKRSALKAIDELVKKIALNPSGEVRLDMGRGWIRVPKVETMVKALKNFSDIFGREENSPVSKELKEIEMKILGEALYSIRNKEDEMLAFFRGMISGEAPHQKYLARRVFDVPQFATDEKWKKRFHKTFSKVYYAFLFKGKVPEVKKFIAALQSPRLEGLCVDMRDVFIDQIHKDGRKKEAAAIYELWRKGEDPGSPDHQDPTFMLGIIASQEGRTEDAISYMNEVIGTNPGKGRVAFFSARAHFKLGEWLLDQERNEEAVHHFKESVRILKENPEHESFENAYPQHLVTLSAVYLHLSMFEEAEPLVLEAAELSAGRFPFCLNALYLFTGTGKHRRALQVIKDFARKYGGSEESMNEKRIYMTLFELYLNFSGSGDNYHKAEARELLKILARRYKPVIKEAISAFEKEESLTLPPEIRNIAI